MSSRQCFTWNTTVSKVMILYGNLFVHFSLTRLVIKLSIATFGIMYLINWMILYQFWSSYTFMEHCRSLISWVFFVHMYIKSNSIKSWYSSMNSMKLRQEDKERAFVRESLESPWQSRGWVGRSSVATLARWKYLNAGSRMIKVACKVVTYN